MEWVLCELMGDQIDMVIIESGYFAVIYQVHLYTSIWDIS